MCKYISFCLFYICFYIIIFDFIICIEKNEFYYVYLCVIYAFFDKSNLDIFSKDMDYIPYDLKVSKIKDLIKKSKVITIASSPFFIEQDYAIKVLKELFNYDII